MGEMNKPEDKTKNKQLNVASAHGQVALETLLIVSFLLVLLIPMLAYMFGSLSQSTWTLDAQQANVAAQKVVSIANSLSLGGEGSSTTETIFLPSSVVSMNVSSNEITFVLNANNLGLIDQSAIANVNLTLNPSSNWSNIKGMNVMQFNLTDGTVLITK